MELQKELKDRGLDSKGKKEELVARLQEFESTGSSSHHNTDAEGNFDDATEWIQKALGNLVSQGMFNRMAQVT